MRYSQYLVPTLKETPQDALIPSHVYMLRAGLIRPLAAGTFTYLPLGMRSLHKAVQIVREEMDRAGAQETLMPALQPLSLWRETGRDEVMGPVLISFKDRRERMMVLGPTHEEVVTDIVRSSVRSYRQLPVNLYQIQTKFRDEERPRGGIIRTREFMMKDAYSFDRGREEMNESYERMYEAYRRIFDRAGLKYLAVEADSGAIGGDVSHEFMVPTPNGEDRMVRCPGCQYAANVERAEVPAPEAVEPGSEGVEEVHTPGMTTIEQVSDFLKTEPQNLVKTILYKAGEKVVAALARGDHEINELKLSRAVGEPIEMADEETVTKVSGARVGFAGPVGLDGALIVADSQVAAMKDFVTGANRDDYHLRSVNRGRDFQIDILADIREAGEGDPCPKCGGVLEVIRSIEVGHVFKLGVKYSEAMGAQYLDEEGALKPLVMGCYGIGVNRILAAAIEQEGGHDENGIIWPIGIAPFHVHIVCTNPSDEQVGEVAEELYHELQSAGLEVLYDDRDERAGVKFNDADLIGIPVRLTVGPRGVKKGVVELKMRDGSREDELPLDEVTGEVTDIVISALEGQAAGS